MLIYTYNMDDNEPFNHIPKHLRNLLDPKTTAQSRMSFWKALQMKRNRVATQRTDDSNRIKNNSDVSINTFREVIKKISSRRRGN